MSSGSADRDDPRSPRDRVRARLRRLVTFGAGAGAAVQISYACVDPPSDDDDWEDYGWCYDPIGPLDIAARMLATAEPGVDDGVMLSFASRSYSPTDWRTVRVREVEGGTLLWENVNGLLLTATVTPDPLVASLVVSVAVNCDGRSEALWYRLDEPSDVPAGGRALEAFEP